MSHTLSAFTWRGKPSIFANTSQQGQGATPGKNHPLRKGLSTPKSNSFCIPPREQAQADTDRRHALRKGGI